MFCAAQIQGAETGSGVGLQYEDPGTRRKREGQDKTSWRKSFFVLFRELSYMG